MFDTKNERTMGEENCQGTKTRNDLVVNAGGETGSEQQVSSSITGFLTSVFGQRMTDVIETRMNKMGVSMYNICQDADSVSEELRALFGTGADILVNSMLKQTFAAHGVEFEETYTRLDLAQRLRKLNELHNARSSNFRPPHFTCRK